MQPTCFTASLRTFNTLADGGRAVVSEKAPIAFLANRTRVGLAYAAHVFPLAWVSGLHGNTPGVGLSGERVGRVVGTRFGQFWVGEEPCCGGMAVSHRPDGHRSGMSNRAGRFPQPSGADDICESQRAGHSTECFRVHPGGGWDELSHVVDGAGIVGEQMSEECAASAADEPFAKGIEQAVSCTLAGFAFPPIDGGVGVE